MRILLDENLDWRLKRDLAGHTVDSVSLIGLAGMKNGALLREAEKHYDAFITMDGNLPHEQNLSKYNLIVIASRPDQPARRHAAANAEGLGASATIIAAIPDCDWLGSS